MTNIKITRRFARGQFEEGTEPEVYDIYFDVGLFSPLIKKWKIDKSALVEEIESLRCTTFTNFDEGVNATVQILLETLDTLEVKEIDIDKLCEFRKNIGFAYLEGASEYQKQLACYRQGIKDVIKAQKGE